MFPVKQMTQTQLNQLLQQVIDEAVSLDIPVSKDIHPQVVVNTRAKSRIGACKKVMGRNEKRFTIEVGDAVLFLDPGIIRGVLAHEVLHTCPDCMNHGPLWKIYAGKLNDACGYDIKRVADFEPNRHKRETCGEIGRTEDRGENGREGCRRAVKYRIECKKCGRVVERVRRSRLVDHTSQYRCPCGGKLFCREVSQPVEREAGKK